MKFTKFIYDVKCSSNKIVSFKLISIRKSGHKKVTLNFIELLFTELLILPFWVYGV